MSDKVIGTFKIEKVKGWFYVSAQNIGGGNFYYLDSKGFSNGKKKTEGYATVTEAQDAIAKFQEDDKVWVINPATKEE